MSAPAVSETGETAGGKQRPEAPVEQQREHPETPVPQAPRPVSQKLETIVSARGEDVSKWRKYATTYYRRSITSASAETRERNRSEYEHWRDLLAAAGYTFREGPERLTIMEPNK